MIVVSDASPLISLHAIDRLDVLRAVFGRVLVPSIVQEEVERGGSRGCDLAALPWMEIRTVSNLAVMAELSAARTPSR